MLRIASSLLVLASLALAEGVDGDVDAVRGIGKEFANAARDFLSNPTTSAELARRRTETAEWVKGLVEKYKDAITGKTAEGNRVATAIKYLNEQMRLFNQKGQSMATDFAKDFDGYVAKANKFADEAAAKKAPKMFDGVRLQLGKAAAMVQVLEGFNGEDDTVKRFRAKLDEARAAIATKDAELRKMAIDEVAMPEDAYAGEDKEKLREAILAAWKKAYPDDEVLAVRMTGTKWERTVRASWDGGAKAWSIGDTSVLPAKVVVRKDAETATIYMAYVNMDTASGSYDIGVKSKTPEYVIQDLPASKVK